MTDQELKKLKRDELLELLVSVSAENEKLKEELAQKQALLDDREIRIATSGSLAEAALKLNYVFEAADAAAEQYLENVRNADSIIQEAQLRAAQIEEEARIKADKHWQDVTTRLENFYKERQDLQNLLNMK